MNKSTFPGNNTTFPWLGIRHPVYPDNLAASVILIVLYVPVFILSMTGNIMSVVILMKNSGKTSLLKNLFLINLFFADLSGKMLKQLSNDTEKNIFKLRVMYTHLRETKLIRPC